MRCALYLIHQAVYARRYLHQPYSIGTTELASRCGASTAVAKRVVGDLERLRIMRQERQGNNLLSICSAYSLREEFMPPQAAFPSSSEN